MGTSKSIVAASSEYAARMGMRALYTNVLPDLADSARHPAAARVSLMQPTREKRLQSSCDSPNISLNEMPIAVNKEDSNVQHYKSQLKFYKVALGKHLKYSRAYFPTPSTSLDEAEKAMLEIYSETAELEDGQFVLDLAVDGVHGGFKLWNAKGFCR